MRKRDLERIETQLRKFVHAPGCKKLNECPRDHNKCRDHLNVFTAIAWKAAYVVIESIEDIKYGTKSSSETINQRMYQIDMLYNVVCLTRSDYLDQLKALDNIDKLKNLLDRAADLHCED